MKLTPPLKFISKQNVILRAYPFTCLMLYDFATGPYFANLSAQVSLLAHCTPATTGFLNMSQVLCTHCFLWLEFSFLKYSHGLLSQFLQGSAQNHLIK